MAPTIHIYAASSWTSWLLPGKSSYSFLYQGLTLFVAHPDQRNQHAIDASQITGSTLSQGLLSNTLDIRTADGRSFPATGLSKQPSARLHNAIQTMLQERHLDETAARTAVDIAPAIREQEQILRQALPADAYIRHSAAQSLAVSVQPIHEACTDRVRRHLDESAVASLTTIDTLTPIVLDETRRQIFNEGHVDREALNVAATTTDLLANGLTDEQTRAIATDEDVTLVLAGAGTGKTAVIIGKIAHLVRNRSVSPTAILALAFNRKAAIEIRERLPPDLQGATVSTFHSFALQVISQSRTAPTISTLAQDDFAYAKALDAIIDQMKADPELSRTLVDFIAGSPTDYIEPFDFDTPADYERYVHDNELRTLNGELVKSFEELTIANFLCESGIRYQYEAPYEHDTASNQYRQYQPDFHLLDHDIYIEHFALNHNGQPPPGWTGYADGVAWKRSLHRQHQTRLIETYSWQHREDVLLPELERQLRDAGVPFQPVPTRELVERLSNEKLSVLSRLIGAFLHHVKSANLSPEEVDRRISQARDRRRAQRFGRLFHRARAEYQRLLDQENAIDFHDLINQAAELIRTGEWTNPYPHVLIDEFQDISDGRMALASALRRPGLAYFLVGDDWQSIYRFAGSRVGLIHFCDQYLGHTQRRDLTRTFRFDDGILKPSSAFIQRNPEQTKRALVSHGRDRDRGVTVIYDPQPASALNHALSAISNDDPDPNPSILVLGRFQSSRSALRNTGDGRRGRNVEFSTVHSAKGREADYVIVLDLNDARYGFPCLVVDDPMLHLVAPNDQAQPFPHAEERRLFYVALTRARKGAYLVAHPASPSPFVRELLAISDQITTAGTANPPCPSCSRGSLVPSQTGDNLRCTSSPTCRYLAPRCPNCQAGYATVDSDNQAASCTNPGCTQPPRLCPLCHTGIIVLRTSPRRFWACTRYWDQHSCTFTEQYHPRTRAA